MVGLVNFHVKKEEYVLQEIWARPIMYNFCERVTLSVVITQKEGRKWTYQVNFTHAIHVCKSYYRHHSDDPPDIAENIAKHILPIRPDRKDRRKIIKQKDFVWFLYCVA